MSRILRTMNKIKKPLLIGAGVVVVFVFVLAFLLQVQAETPEAPASRGLDSSYGIVSNVTDIPAEVTFNGKTYTKDNPYVILEIVPHKSLGELGYMVGGDSMSVQAGDMKVLENYLTELEKTNPALAASEKQAIRWKLKNTLDQCIHPNADVNLYALDGSVPTIFQDRNVLARILFGEDNTQADIRTGYSIMSDKFVVRTMQDSEVTVEDVDAADMIYMNPQSHDNAYYSNYTFFTDMFNKYNLNSTEHLSQVYNYDTVVRSQNRNLQATAALEIYMRNVKEKLPVIYDWSVAANGLSTVMDGYSSLNYLECGIDPEVFLKEYASVDRATAAQKAAGTYIYSGDFGYIQADKTGMTVYKGAYGSGAALKWEPYMFISAHGLWVSQYPYYNVYRGSEYLHDNFYSFPGNNTMTIDLVGGSSGLGAAEGNDYDKIMDQYGFKDEWGNTKLYITDCLKYIMGVKLKVNITTLNVLEIQPQGGYNFNTGNAQQGDYQFNYYTNNTVNGAINIIKAFGVVNDHYEVAEEHHSFDSYTGMGSYQVEAWDDADADNRSAYTVHIRSLSANAFNGLNADLKAMYDLVILGSYNPDGYINRNLDGKGGDDGIYNKGVTLTKSGEVTLSTSGNDLTEKAYENLLAYVRAGLPLLESKDVYDGSDLDSNTNVHKLSYNSLTDLAAGTGETHLTDNVHYMSKDSNAEKVTVNRKLKYVAKPDFVIVNPVAYNGDNSSLLNVKDVQFMIDTAAGAETAVKIYIDRNSDGMYNEVESQDDYREIYYNGFLNDTGVKAENNRYTIPVELPSELFGYVSFKIELTNASKTCAKIGAFAIRTTKRRSIKVLQIYKGDKPGDSTLNVQGSTFQRSFANASVITNMSLSVTSMNVSEFEKTIKQNEDLLNDYTMLVVGFADSFGKDDDKNGGDTIHDEAALQAIADYIDAGKSVLFTHDTMSYEGYATKNSKYAMTTALKDKIGMTGSVTNLITLKTHNKTLFTDLKASANVSDRYTNRISKLNEGQITEYPYKIDSTIETAETHGQFFQLNLNRVVNTDAYGASAANIYNDDMVVWFTQSYSDDKPSYKKGSPFYGYAGQDAVNNYYIYSKGNVTYTTAGHSSINDDEQEMKLFVNTFVRALLSGSMPPEIEVTNGTLRDDNHNYEIIRRNRTTNESGETQMMIRLPNAGGGFDYYMSSDGTTPLTDGAGNPVYGQIPVEFVVLDEDLPLNSELKEGTVYIDVNQDGVYKEGTDILLASYDNKTNKLLNGATNTVDVLGLARTASQTIPGKNALATLVDLYNTNQLRIGITATDYTKASGNASAMFIKRDYFILG